MPRASNSPELRNIRTAGAARVEFCLGSSSQAHIGTDVVKNKQIIKTYYIYIYKYIYIYICMRTRTRTNLEARLRLSSNMRLHTETVRTRDRSRLLCPGSWTPPARTRRSQRAQKGMCLKLDRDPKYDVIIFFDQAIQARNITIYIYMI